MIGSSRVAEARNVVSALAVLRSGNGFGAMREDSHDADVAGSEFYLLPRQCHCHIDDVLFSYYVFQRLGVYAKTSPLMRKVS